MTKQNAINPIPAWIAVTNFQNGWINYGTLPEAEFSINSLGQVQVQGIIKDGISGVVFNLPIGYRPKKIKGLRLFASDLQAYAIVYPSGDLSIALPTNSNTYLYLDNILFSIY